MVVEVYVLVDIYLLLFALEFNEFQLLMYVHTISSFNTKCS